MQRRSWLLKNGGALKCCDRFWRSGLSSVPSRTGKASDSCWLAAKEEGLRRSLLVDPEDEGCIETVSVPSSEASSCSTTKKFSRIHLKKTFAIRTTAGLDIGKKFVLSRQSSFCMQCRPR